MILACVLIPLLAADVFLPLELPDVQVGGEIGRRIAITITNNLLVLDADRDFLPPFRNDAVRLGGLGCRVSAWKPGFGLGARADYELTLTEFPDPEGRATYFRLRDYRVAVDDELLAGAQ